MFKDWTYYYDDSVEKKLDNWEKIQQDGKQFILQCNIETKAGYHVILFPHWEHEDNYPVIEKITVNGKTYAAGEADSNYIWTGSFHYHCSRQGIRVKFQTGINEIRVLVKALREDPITDLHMSCINDQQMTERRVYRAEIPYPGDWRDYKTGIYDISGYKPGVGNKQSPGRFGFSKGDGLLDCAMPALGVVDKMFMSGHPKYRKPFRWGYSVLPEHMEKHGSTIPARKGIENDHIDINHLSVNWRTKGFSCTYSLATPGIISESDSGYSRISSLEYAGNYQFMMIPRHDFVEIVSIDEVQNIRMSENWLLFFGCTEFPDLPLLVVFEHQPKRFEVRRDPVHGRLSELLFHGSSLMITATPFGCESFEPISPDDVEFLNKCLESCRFWSRAFMAYPVKCEEYFRNNHQEQKVSIIQEFSYRYIRDDWNTVPQKTAPLPPVCSLSSTVESNDDYALRFSTKYGYLDVVPGHSSRYTIPFMPVARKFPLRDSERKQAEEVFAKGLNEYFSFVEKFPDDIQSYPYSGALLEPFAYPSTMMNFMPREYREKIRYYITQRLKFACDENRQYRYPVINHSCMMSKNPSLNETVEMYNSPEMKYKTLWNWYERTEPFTGFKYHICYINLCLFTENKIIEGTREEVAAYSKPLVENDWGAGLTFYYMYLGALCTGDFSEIKKNWKLLKSVYSFFDAMHDWACMGTGYSDNAVAWVEGANYGAFTSYINMAEAVEDHDAYEYGIYLAAKQMALRFAVIRSSQHYFHRLFGVTPWFIHKFFREEANPSLQFLCAPDKLYEDFRNDGIYNLTTEGIYPEIFDALHKFLPKEFSLIRNKLRKYLRRENPVSPFEWLDIQQTASLLISEVLDENISEDDFLHELENAEKGNLLMREWRGIHIFSRMLPENYFKAQLLAWLNMRNHMLWLEHWENIVLDDTEWTDKRAVINFKAGRGKMKIRMGTRCLPQTVLLNGKEIQYFLTNSGKLEVYPFECGILEISYEGKK